MTKRLLQDPRLLRKYIEKKQEQLQQISDELDELPLEAPERSRLLEKMLYLQNGIPPLWQRYAEIASGFSDSQSASDAAGSLRTRTSGTPVEDRPENDRLEEAIAKLDVMVAHLSRIVRSGSVPSTEEAAKATGLNTLDTKNVGDQLIMGCDERSKGVREGNTVDLFYKQLGQMRSFYRNQGWTATKIRQRTTQEFAVLWEWIDRIKDQDRKSAFLDVTEWEDGAKFIFLQIATLYEYAPHLRKRQPSWSTIRDWRKAYLGYKRHRTRDGRRP
jgi:hypothetical protein